MRQELDGGAVAAPYGNPGRYGNAAGRSIYRAFRPVSLIKGILSGKGVHQRPP